MDLKITTQGKTYTCAECKNDTELEGSIGVGDVIECPFCGIEYEVSSGDAEGNFSLILIEEEK